MPRTVAPKPDYEIRIVGGRRTPLRDFYYALLLLPWWATIAGIAGAFLAINGLFALGFLLTGGVAHAAPGSFADAFFFSVQTMGTIGYGAMFPESRAANALVAGESITGITLTAMAAGLVFAKFSRPTARLVFTREAVISPMNGVPTLQFRLGNERSNQIVDCQIRAVLVRTEKTHEGSTFYRTIDLRLARERLFSLSRSWTVLHPIDASSPLHGVTPELAVEQEMELQVLVVGLDDTTMQTVHGGHRYFTKQILWGARLADVLSEPSPDLLVLDLRRFHDVESSEPTADFPYPRR